MNYILVDCENINRDQIKDFKGIKDGDALILFYSEQHKSTTIDVMDFVSRHNLKLECHKVKTGSGHALDFQLSSYLGYLIAKNNDASIKYCIVAGDKGYDVLIDFWKKRNIIVNRKTLPEAKKNISEVTITVKNNSKKENKDEVKKPEEKMATLKEISQYLSKDDKPEEVLTIFNQYKTKQTINRGIDKLFKDSNITSKIAKKLKPLYKEKGKN